MCGIAGHVRRRGRGDTEQVRAQLRTVLHRGPDAVGVFAAGPVAIGQTRLSVIDLVTGDPPITTPDGACGVALNGEIYNYRELRDRTLIGHDFTTAGDTEIIAHLAEDRAGAALARPLRGMFGFAAHNSRTGVTTLARDVMGEKPLYYHLSDDLLVFGSEIKAVLAHPEVPRRPNLDALPSYLALGAAGSPWTMFEGILQLPPGHTMRIDPDFRVIIEPFWELQVPGVHDVTKLDVSFAESVDLVTARLREAVRRRLVADVPLGAFLSGGIDSSLVVALMAEATSMPVRTFTIGVEDADGFDERPFAARVARYCGTDHHEYVVRPDAVDLLQRLVHHYDEPFGDSSAIPTYLVSKMARRHVTVALSGDGGDELFGGYPRFIAGTALAWIEAVPQALRAPLLDGLRRLPGSQVAGFVDGAVLGLPDAFLRWISFVRHDDVARLLGGTIPESPGVTAYRDLWATTAGARALDRLLHLNARTYLVDDLLPKVDRASMANGLEVRSPFLDQDLVQLAFRLPSSHKVRGRSLKRVLKAVARRFVPDEVIDRPKAGFGLPLGRWFRTDLAPYVDDRLLRVGARLHQFVDATALRDLVAEHQAGRAHDHTLWTLLTLEEWLLREGF
jgi:asparagine synthase (glutamine-hydrolysing)